MTYCTALRDRTVEGNMPRIIVVAVTLALLLGTVSTTAGVMLSQAAFSRAALIKQGKADTQRSQNHSVGMKARDASR
jgi:hypothetical protein